jgi:NAD(P)-dependent dehydrogenase (short-subunit alcohol dehydrogenase family)
MNKVVIITGASGGIGQGIARLFLDRGFDALLHTRSKPDVLEAF